MDELKHRLEKARASFQEKMEAVLTELTAQFRRWDGLVDANGDAEERRPVLQAMSEILNRHSYIRNLVRNVSEELEV